MSKRKIQLGDIFTIQTKKGKALLQLVYSDNDGNELVKVFYKIYQEISERITLDLDKDFFFIDFPLKAAYNKGIIEKIYNIPLAKDFQKPKYMRTHAILKNKGWHIVNTNTLKREYVEELSEEQKKLSPWGTWNDTLLIENLENGWRLENWIE